MQDQISLKFRVPFERQAALWTALRRGRLKLTADDNPPSGAAMRHSRVVRTPGGTQVELAFFLESEAAGEAARAPCEISFELKAGPASGLFALAALWVERHGLWLNGGLNGGLDGGHQSPAVKARPPSFPAKPDPRQFARACIEACLAQVLPNAGALAAGSEQPQHVHQLRVGLRRLRTALSEMAEFDCGIDAGWEPGLALLFRALGLERDHHMLVQMNETLLAAGSPPLPLLPPLAPAESPSKLLRANEIQQILLAVLAFAMDAAPASAPAFEGKPLEAIAGRLDHLRHRLKRDAGRLAEASIESRHRTRKQLKRLRYLAEFVAPLFDEHAADRYLQDLRRAQDALGASTDEALALAHYQQHVPDHPGACFAVGWLSARQASSVDAAAKALKAAMKAPRLWRAKRRSNGSTAD